MPQEFNQMIQSMVDNPDFYPERSANERRKIASTIAKKRCNTQKQASYTKASLLTSLNKIAKKLDQHDQHEESDMVMRVVLDLMRHNMS